MKTYTGQMAVYDANNDVTNDPLLIDGLSGYPAKSTLTYSGQGGMNLTGLGATYFVNGVAIGTGTVSSVSFTGDGTVFSNIPTTPVTTSGTLTPTLTVQNANLFLASPTSGSGFPTFRGIAASDIPILNTLTVSAATPTGTGSNLGIGNTTGFGNGSSGTAVTTTTKGTGGGPATPQTVVDHLEIDIGGTKYWIPLVQ